MTGRTALPGSRVSEDAVKRVMERTRQRDQMLVAMLRAYADTHPVEAVQTAMTDAADRLEHAGIAEALLAGLTELVQDGGDGVVLRHEPSGPPHSDDGLPPRLFYVDVCDHFGVHPPEEVPRHSKFNLALAEAIALAEATE